MPAESVSTVSARVHVPRTCPSRGRVSPLDMDTGQDTDKNARRGEGVADLWEYRCRRADPQTLLAPLVAAVQDAHPGGRVRALGHTASLVVRHADAGRLPLGEALGALAEAAADAGLSTAQIDLVLAAVVYGPHRPVDRALRHGAPGGSA
jgi:hypothetical protein